MTNDLDAEAKKTCELLRGQVVENVYRDNKYEVIITFSEDLELLAYCTAEGELELSIAPTSEHRKKKP